jgi:hypothetical protein
MDSTRLITVTVIESLSASSGLSGELDLATIVVVPLVLCNRYHMVAVAGLQGGLRGHRPALLLYHC